jgi:hypothetical protein
VGAVTSTPVATLGLSKMKRNLISYADTDLVIIEEEVDESGWRNL